MAITITTEDLQNKNTIMTTMTATMPSNRRGAIPTVIITTMEKATTSNNILMLFVRAIGMKSTSSKTANIFGAANPFFEISNVHNEIVARSNILVEDSTPKWAPIKLDLEALCGFDKHQRVYLKFYDHQSSGEHGLIKQIVTTVDGMMQSAKDFRVIRSIQTATAAQVCIYDAFVTTGKATAGTLVKQRKVAKSPPTVATSADSSEEEQSVDECIGRVISIGEPATGGAIQDDGVSVQTGDDESIEEEEESSDNAAAKFKVRESIESPDESALDHYEANFLKLTEGSLIMLEASDLQ